MTTTEGNAADQSIEITAHADAALRSVRVVLAVLSVLLIAAYRPLTGPPSWGSLSITLVAIIVVTGVLNTISRRAPGHQRWAALMQTLDVAAMVGLVVALDEPLDHQAWVLLVVPVVSAAVRSGGAASLVSWIGGSLGYLAAAFAGAIESSADVALVTRVPGTLLAVAITIGLLARWMREGWEVQNEITAVVAARERRLAVLEQTRHALTNTETDDALTLCANQAITLGFEAVTVHHLTHDRPALAIGRTEIVSAVDPTQHNTSGGPVVTVWTDGSEAHSYSAAVRERHTNNLVTGWSRSAIDGDRAQALATLVSITSNAIESGTLLRKLRHAANHDPLTGLLNRGGFDSALTTAAAEPGRLAIAFIDLDDFKHINDTYGHDIGDRALIVVAQRLKAVVGPHGFISRYGGDEFVAILPGVSLANAQRFAQAALDALSGTVVLGQVHTNLRFSVGVAAAQTPIAPTEVLHAADKALYQAKSAGKATFVAFDLDGPEPVETTDHRIGDPTPKALT